MKTTGAAPSRLPESYWEPDPDDLKHYPHFDAPLRLSEIRRIVNDPKLVARNAFFPLIQYTKTWQPYRTPKSKTKSKPEAKPRKIRYAARRDAYIYARYRRYLAPLYEAELLKRGINEIPIAYRKIKGPDNKGKCNIEFAKDVFDYIASTEYCYVITLDISKFFESLDHNKIKKDVKNLLGNIELPDDYAAVIRSLTKYSWVDRTETYERLGYFGYIQTKNGTIRKGFLRPYSEMPKQLCSPKDFRDKIAGKGKWPSIIHKNEGNVGIPQGTPISDLIANIYMMDFDAKLQSIVTSIGGMCCRYSDDILVVLNTSSQEEAFYIEEKIRDSISEFGDYLVIKESKSSIHRYFKAENGNDYEHLKGSGRNGVEYLGFRFDGNNVYLKDSTLANLKRKMAFSAKVRATKHAKRFPNRNLQELEESFNFEYFFQSFMRVEEFDRAKSVKNWTFWTYARRASEAFGPRGKGIYRQLRWLKPDGAARIKRTLGTQR